MIRPLTCHLFFQCVSCNFDFNHLILSVSSVQWTKLHRQWPLMASSFKARVSRSVVHMITNLYPAWARTPVSMCLVLSQLMVFNPKYLWHISWVIRNQYLTGACSPCFPFDISYCCHRVFFRCRFHSCSWLSPQALHWRFAQLLERWPG